MAGRWSQILKLLGVAACAALSQTPATAQSWPTKPITVVVPFPAGSGIDAFAQPPRPSGGPTW
jgi:tripartite-type tricarboxylate transporter receptor subunit TctC